MGCTMLNHSQTLQLKLANKKVERALSLMCQIIHEKGGRALVVGGSVRDAALNMASKDLDIEVYGIEGPELEALLARHFAIDLVGKSFGVIKVKGIPIDVALPRRESKSGTGHRGFDVASDPMMTTLEAQSRRDFTINAMAYDPLTGELIDHFDGRSDLDQKILRHTSDKFAEDPLRVLRGMQFAARFDLTVAPETIKICQSITPEGLASERLFEEWKKLILSGEKPSKGLTFLKDCGWIQYYPELEALVGCRQSPKWHPEGDVWTHTLLSMDAFAKERLGESWEDLVVGIAVLCHDMGKPTTTEEVNGKIRSLAHEHAGIEPTVSFLERLTNQRDLIDQVVPLVVHHMKPSDFYKGKAGNAAVRRLSVMVGRIDRLVRVARADQGGRKNASDPVFEAGHWLLNKAENLEVSRNEPRPIVLGRHLISLGLEPGPHFKGLLDACFEAQIEGKISDEASGIEFARKLVQKLS